MRIVLAGPARLRDHSDSLGGALPELAALSGASVIGLLAPALRRRGHEVVVVTLSPDVQGAPVRFGGEGLEIHVGPYRAGHRARDAFAAERAAVREMIGGIGDPDVVHAHWTYEFALGALATQLPAVVTVHDWAPRVLHYQPHPYRLVRLALTARVLGRARHLTAVSPYIADRVARWTGRRPSLIPNGLPADEFVTAVDDPPADGPVLVAINDGFSSWKNVGTLLQAFPRIRLRHPTARLRLVGQDHGPGEAAEHWARDRGLDAGVQFVGRLPRVETMDLLAEAHVFVHPSREESFGLVLVEAMARGVPVVAGRDSGGVPWVCRYGRVGVLTDVTSPLALAAAVATVLDDPARSRALAERALVHARTWFAEDRVAAGYEATYGDAIRGVGAPR